MQGHSNLTDHHCGRWLQLSRNMIAFDAALPTSKLEAVEPDSGSTCCAIETSVCAQCERIFHLACWRCPRAIANELIIAPSQHARTFTRADKHVEWLPRLTRRSSGQLLAFVAVINHPLQMTSRTAPHHSEGSLSAPRNTVNFVSNTQFHLSERDRNDLSS